MQKSTTSVPSSMRAALARAAGEPLRLTRMETPQPSSGEVLVRVAASGVNPLDLKILAGAAEHARQPLPNILGIDMAGTVAAVGRDVTRFAEGDAVYGMAGGVGGHPGSLAEYMAVDARLLAHKPKVLTMREAAAVPLAFITAWEGLVDRAHLHAGQHVLVQGGAGGVGQMAVQITHALGARVTATGSPRARATVEGMGARFIDKSEPASEIVARETEGRGFDVVFDTAGGKSLDAAFASVGRFGHVVSALGWGAHALAPLSFKAATYSGIFTLLPLLTSEGLTEHGAFLAKAAAFADAGKLVPALDPRRFELAAAQDAYKAIEFGAATGKVVVDVEEETDDE